MYCNSFIFLVAWKMTAPIRVLVTGAAGQIGYSLVLQIAKGDVFGKDTVCFTFMQKNLKIYVIYDLYISIFFSAHYSGPSWYRSNDWGSPWCWIWTYWLRFRHFEGRWDHYHRRSCLQGYRLRFLGWRYAKKRRHGTQGLVGCQRKNLQISRKSFGYLCQANH